MAAEGVLDIAGHCEVGPGVWRLQGIVPEFHGKQNQNLILTQGQSVGLSH